MRSRIKGMCADFLMYPTIAAGGRYDNLVSDGKAALPGIGMSIGITRVLGLVLHEGIQRSSRKVPSAALVALVSDQDRTNAEESQAICGELAYPARYFLMHSNMFILFTIGGSYVRRIIIFARTCFPPQQPRC